jgi:hypothetical protein
MNQLTEFQQRACSAAVTKMIGGKHFSVCDLSSNAKVMGRESFLAGRDYAALQSVHCVDWADMGSDLTNMTREKCLEILGLPAQIIEDIKSEQPAKRTTEPAKRLSLAFWRDVKP